MPSTVVPISVACPRRLRRLPVPQTEPPYDDDAHAHPTAARWAGAVQGILALSFALPSGLSAVPEAYRPAVPPPPRPAVLGLPDPHGPAIRLAQAIVEVLAGARPASQLLRWTTQQVYTGILTRVAERPPRGTATAPVPAGPEASSGTRPARACARVHVTRVCEPADGVAEASVMVRWGPRSRAMALRLEARNGCWICTALELGP